MTKYSLLLLVIILSVCTHIFAQFKPKDVHSWTENHNIPANLKVGDEITLNFTCKMNDGFHVYSANQPVAKPPIRPLLFLLDKSAKGVEVVGKVVDGAGGKKTEYDDIFRSDVTFYEKTATFSQKIKITAENPVLAAYLDYQICDESMCIPSTYEFVVPLKVGAGGAATPPTQAAPIPTKEAKGDFPPPAPAPVAVVKVLPKDSLASAKTQETALSAEEQTSILNGLHWTINNDPNPATAPKIGDILSILMRVKLEPSIQLRADAATPSFEFAAGQSSGFEEVGEVKIVGKKKTLKGKTFYEDSVTLVQQVKIIAENPVFKGLLNFTASSNNKQVIGQIEVIPAFAWAKGAKEETKVDSTEPAKGQGCDLWFLVLKGLGLGLLAAFTPCFYPMIPLTVSYFTKQSSSRRRGIFNALFYGASIISIFTILALGLSFAFGNTILNEIATNGWVNLFLFILIFAFGLSFLGWFDMSLPSSWSTKLSSKASTTSFTGIFFMALTLVVVSFSCTGVFVAQLMSSASDGGSLWCIIVPMLAFSSTLALPFVLFAVFPSLLQSLPKSGGWLGTFKISLGFLEIALAFSYLSNVDLVWNLHILPRELYLGIWIAIAFALTIYLLGFLKIDNDYQPDSISVPRLLIALMFLSLGFYMIPGMFGRQLKLLDAIAIIPPIAAGEGADNHANSPSNASFSTSDICHFPNKKYDYLNEHTPEGLCAFYDIDQGLEYAKKANKPVLLDFTGHTCKNCRKVEQTIWTDPAIKRMLQEDFVLVSLFTDDAVPLEAEEISPNGAKLRDLGDKWQDYEVRIYNVPAQPYYVMLDYDKSSLFPPFGYQEAPDVATYKQNLEEGLKEFKARHKKN